MKDLREPLPTGVLKAMAGWGGHGLACVEAAEGVRLVTDFSRMKRDEKWSLVIWGVFLSVFVCVGVYVTFTGAGWAGLIFVVGPIAMFGVFYAVQKGNTAKRMGKGPWAKEGEVILEWRRADRSTRAYLFPGKGMELATPGIVVRPLRLTLPIIGTVPMLRLRVAACAGAGPDGQPRWFPLMMENGSADRSRAELKKYAEATRTPMEDSIEIQSVVLMEVAEKR